MMSFGVITAPTNAFIVASTSHFSLTMFFRSLQSIIKASRFLASQTAASSSKPTTAMSGGRVSAELQLLLCLALIFGFQTFFGLALTGSSPSGSGKMRFSSSHLIVGLAAYKQDIPNMRPQPVKSAPMIETTIIAWWLCLSCTCNTILWCWYIWILKLPSILSSRDRLSSPINPCRLTIFYNIRFHVVLKLIMICAWKTFEFAYAVKSWNKW